MKYKKLYIRYICNYCKKVVYHVYTGGHTLGPDYDISDKYHIKKVRNYCIEKITSHMEVCERFNNDVKNSNGEFLPLYKQRY